MISGTLPNNTVWWISTDGKKVWIESKELENKKFVDKGYGIVKDRIFNHRIGKQVGELTGSRLERRLYKDSWIVALDTFLDIYPDLLSEIGNKSIEEKKKKRQTRSTTKSTMKSKMSKIPHKETEKDKEEIGHLGEKLGQEREQEKKEEKIIERSYFDIEYPYVEWIKGEINKNPNGELKILSDDMKEKMGKEYLNMHTMRIYFGLKKILPEIGIDVELGKLKGKSALTMKKIR